MRYTLTKLSFLTLIIASCNTGQHTEMAGESVYDYVKHLNQGHIERDTLKGSPRLMESSINNDLKIDINYSSPGVRERTIWGGLVAYDQVWVTGAHRATSVNFSSPVIIDGTTIPAGKYAFFTLRCFNLSSK